MADDKVQIVIEVDAKQAQAAIDTFSKSSVKALDQTADEIKKSTGSSSSGLKSLASSFSSLLPTMTPVAIAIAAVGAALKVFSKASEEASKAAKLNLQISASLAATDEAGIDATNAILKYSDALSNLTGIDDDVINGSFLIAKSFGLSADQAKKLTTAAVDLSAATGQDLETSTRLLAQTYDGTIGKAANLGSEFRNLTESQLKNGEAIDLVAEKYSGAAAKALNTYEGQANRLSNALDDLFKAIGRVDQNKADTGLKAFFSSIVEGTTEIINKSKDLEETRSALFRISKLDFVRAGESSKELSTSFKDMVETSDAAAKSVKSVQRAADSTFDEFISKTVPFVASTKLSGKALEDFNKKAQDLLEAGKKFKAGILGSFGSQTETETAKSKAAIDSVNKALMDGIISAKTAAEFRILINKDLNDKITKQNADANEKRQKQDEETAKKAKEAAKEAEDAVSKTAAQIGKVVGFAGQGKEGAKGAVAAGAGAAANAVLPGSGALAEQVVLLLASGKVAGAFVKEFIKAIPDIFLNIADAIPEILAGIIETVFTPEFLIRLGFAIGKSFLAVATLGLTNFAPEWGRKVGEEISKYVDFSAAAEKISAVFAEIGNTISAFFTGFADQLKSVFAPLIEPIQQLISALQSVAGQGGGQGKARDIGGAISDKFKSTFGFSKGGIVPLYAANGAFVPRGTDTVPAMLTPGERVLSVPTTNNLDTFMSSQSSGQEQTMAVLSAILQALQAPMVVNAEAKVNQSAFADIILQLNRQNMRLSA